MRFFTNKGIVQKTVIALLIVILTTFAVPQTVQADTGGKLANPIINFVVAIFDGVHQLLEMAMLGETQTFLKEIDSGAYEAKAAETDLEKNIKVEQKIDSSFWGTNKVQIPVINYTPEAIFSNQVPALDVNFIDPSVKTGNSNYDRNIAKKLQPIIASWYTTLRIIAIVGLLSVLVYLGIRMLLTSVAADRAKYKKMLMDWIIGMCLVFTLHYIMAFAMTMAETVTAMLASEANGTFTVEIAQNGKTFGANLMSYVRFMVQAEDFHLKIAFMALYIMLVIFTIRFTWIYLKRVVNMAFLTLMAPLVALMYPIDKVSDGKAQAFDMWLKEYIYNALIQPVDLLLYKVLLGSAIQLAVDNTVYAIVALGFIIAAENLVKKMFGFGKASGGTLGSLAGAAGVSAFAGKMLNDVGKKGPSGGGNGKVRTKDIPERSGKDKNANKGFDAVEGKDASQLIGGGKPTEDDDGVPAPDRDDGVPAPDRDDGVPAPTDDNDVPAPSGLTPEEQREFDELDARKTGLYGDNASYLPEDAQRWQELNDKQNSVQPINEDEKQDNDASELPIPDDASNKAEEKGFFATVRDDYNNFVDRKVDGLGNIVDNIAGIKDKDKRAQLWSNAKKGISKRAIGAWKALPTVGYKAARGTLRTASRVALAGAMGTMGAIIGATTGDGDKAISMAMGAAGVGFATGDNLFDATLGQVIPNKSVRDAYGAGKYGSIEDAQNARADKAYLRSEKFNNFYDKEFKDKYSKKDFAKIVESYRKSGITSEKDIKKAMKLEDYYKKTNKHLDGENIRKQVQNIVAGYNELDGGQKRAFSGDKKAEKALQNEILTMLGGDTKEHRAQMNTIYQGYLDYRTKT